MTATAGASLAAQLQDNLQAQRDCAQHLLGILQAERAALAAADVERLEALTQSKAEAAGLLQKLGSALTQLRGAARLPDSGGAGIERWFGQLRLPSLPGLWKELLALAEQCQRANLDNAVLLSTREAQLKQTLRAFRPADAAELYGRSGHAPLDLPARHFGAA